MRDLWNRFRKHRGAVVALGVIVFVGLVAAVGPWVAPHGALKQNWEAIERAPSWQYLLGTDGSGRGVFSRMIYGARISLMVSVVSVGIATIAGTVLGVLAGYFRGWLDEVVSRFVDMLFAFPDIVLALVIMAVLGASRINLMIAIGVVYTPIFARVARGAVLAVMGQPYVEAARAMGIGHTRIMARHVLPNIVGPVVVQVTLSLAFAVLAEAALSFLGLGVEPDAPSWGNMLLEGKRIMGQAWWVAAFPGVAITVVVLSFNVMGDGLRDALDVKK